MASTALGASPGVTPRTLARQMRELADDAAVRREVRHVSNES